jgi:hypothetical protein
MIHLYFAYVSSIAMCLPVRILEIRVKLAFCAESHVDMWYEYDVKFHDPLMPMKFLNSHMKIGLP